MPFEPREPHRTRRDALAMQIGSAYGGIMDPLASLFGARYTNPYAGEFMMPGALTYSGLSGSFTQAPNYYSPSDVLAGDEIDQYMASRGIGNTRDEIDTRAATNQQQRRTPPNPFNDPLWRRLVRSANDVPVIDFDQLIADQTGALMKAYRPQIKGIKGQIKRTKAESEESQEKIGGLYGALNRRISRQAGRVDKQTATERENLTEQQQNREDAASNAIMADARAMADTLRGMGQTQQADEIMKRAQENIQERTGEISAEGQFERAQATRSGDSEEEYLRRMAQGAALEGNEQVAAIAQQEADIIAENRQMIAGLKQARGSEISGMETGLRQAEAESNVDAARMVWDRLFGLEGMKLDIEGLQFQKDQAKANLLLAQQEAAAGGTTAAESPLANNYDDALANLAKIQDPQTRNKATRFWKTFLEDPLVMGGQIAGPDEEPTAYTPLQQAHDAKKKALEAGFDPRVAQIIYNAMYSFAAKGKG